MRPLLRLYPPQIREYPESARHLLGAACRQVAYARTADQVFGALCGIRSTAALLNAAFRRQPRCLTMVPTGLGEASLGTVCGPWSVRAPR